MEVRKFDPGLRSSNALKCRWLFSVPSQVLHRINSSQQDMLCMSHLARIRRDQSLSKNPGGLQGSTHQKEKKYNGTSTCHGQCPGDTLGMDRLDCNWRPCGR